MPMSRMRSHRRQHQIHAPKHLVQPPIIDLPHPDATRTRRPHPPNPQPRLRRILQPHRPPDEPHTPRPHQPPHSRPSHPHRLRITPGKPQIRGPDSIHPPPHPRHSLPGQHPPTRSRIPRLPGEEPRRSEPRTIRTRQPPVPHLHPEHPAPGGRNPHGSGPVTPSSQGYYPRGHGNSGPGGRPPGRPVVPPGVDGTTMPPDPPGPPGRPRPRHSGTPHRNAPGVEESPPLGPPPFDGDRHPGQRQPLPVPHPSVHGTRPNARLSPPHLPKHAQHRINPLQPLQGPLQHLHGTHGPRPNGGGDRNGATGRRQAHGAPRSSSNAMTPTSVAPLTISRRRIIPAREESGTHSTRSDSLRSVGAPTHRASSVRNT